MCCTMLMQPNYGTINLLCLYFPCFEVSHYLCFTIMAPLLFVQSTKLHNLEKIKRALCNLHPLRYQKKALCPRWALALGVGPSFNISSLIELQHSTLLSGKPRHNEGAELLLPPTSERSILGQRTFSLLSPPLFLLLFYLVINENDKCWKWKFSGVTWAHPARKNLKDRAPVKDILVHWVQSCLDNTLSTPLQKFTKFPFEDSPITVLLTRELFQSFIPLVITNLPVMSLGFFPQKLLYPVNSAVFPPV